MCKLIIISVISFLSCLYSVFHQHYIFQGDSGGPLNCFDKKNEKLSDPIRISHVSILANDFRTA